jgi:hypothetical protein
VKRSPRTPPRWRRRRLLVAAAGLGVLVALLVGWRLRRDSDRSRPVAVARSTGQPATRLPAFTGSPARPDLPAPVAGPKGTPTFRPIPGRGPGGALPPAPAAGPGPELLAYGGRSGRLPADRTVAPVEPRAETGSTEKRPELTVSLPSLRATAAGTTLHARVDAGGRGLLGAVSAEVALASEPETTPSAFSAMPASGPAGGPAVEFAFVYRPDRAVRDPAGPTPGRPPPPTAVRYLVRARGNLDGAAFERTAGGIFYVHHPGGHLQAGAAEVLRQEGDLRVKVEAVIERPGTYFAYAELWGGAGGDRPIAFARERLVGVERGTRQLLLLFGGKIVKESGVDGPYVVRNLRFQQVDTHPAHEAEPVAALPPTAAYRAQDFH